MHLPFILFMIPTKCKFDTLLFHKYFAVRTLSTMIFPCQQCLSHLQCYPIVIVTVVFDFRAQDQSFHFGYTS